MRQLSEVMWLGIAIWGILLYCQSDPMIRNHRIFRDIMYELYHNIPQIMPYVKLFCLACILVCIARVILYRYLKMSWSRFRKKNVKRELNPRDQNKIDLQFQPYSIFKYFGPTFLDQLLNREFKISSYFLGRLHHCKRAIYATVGDIARHVKVIGKTGSGKTESVLKPIAIQNACMKHPTIFIDGKGDQGLISQFNYSFSNEQNRQFLNFNTIAVVEDDGSKLDVLTTSNTFNPLMAFKEPEQLRDMLISALDMESEGDGQYYIEYQTAFLTHLFHLFLATGKKFTFEDISEFISYPDVRKYVYTLANEKGNKLEVSNMSLFLDKLSKNDAELMGLNNKINQLFVSDKTIASLINVYDSEINIEESLQKKDMVLFSLSCGNKFKTNQALAKMIVSIMNDLVGAKQGYEKKPFWMFILDEFGTYATRALAPMIVTARNTNTSMVLSYQTDAQLNHIDGLSDVIQNSTDIKFIFNSPELADDYAKYFGTVESTKKTDVLEEDLFATEAIQGRASIREVSEFKINANVFRSLLPGQSVCKYPSKTNGMAADIMDHAMLKLESNKFRLNRTLKNEGGLDLKKNRLLVRNNEQDNKKKTVKRESNNKEPQPETIETGITI